MKQELKKHFLAYSILMLLLIVGVGFLMRVWPNHRLQQVGAVLLGCGYFTWGVITHTKSQTLTRSVVKEYFGVSLLGVMMLLLIVM